MPDNLPQEHCVPCEGGTLPLMETEYHPLLLQLSPNWKITNSKTLIREFVFADFKEALSFANQVGTIAETENHHPDINLHDYKKVTISLSTHAIGGLSKNDFIVASKIESLKN